MLSRAVAGGSGNGGFSVNSNRRCQIERWSESAPELKLLW